MRYICILSSLLTAAVLAASDVKFTVLPDRADGMYKVGEEIRFTVKAENCDEPLFYQLSYDDGVRYGSKKPVENGVITVKAEKPGFIAVSVSPAREIRNQSNQRIYGWAGAGIEPEKIRPVPNKPADFDRFWADEIAALRREKLQVKTTELKGNYGNLRCYSVMLKQGKLEASGFLIIPGGTKKKSLPLIVSFNAAGAVNASLFRAREDASLGAVSFNLNYQPFSSEITLSDEEYARRKKIIGEYRWDNADDRDLYSMKNIYLRGVMALDHLQTIPEYDGQTFIVHGTSFGGAQAIVAAALTPQVKFCISNVTALCDQRARAANRRPGWPWITDYKPEAEKVTGYFDVVNFAPMIKNCKVIMAPGFIDLVCPPATVYAAYSQLGTADKQILPRVGGEHHPSRIPGEGNAGAKDQIWLKDYLKSRGFPGEIVMETGWRQEKEGDITYFANEYGFWDYPRGATVVTAGTLKKEFDLTAQDIAGAKKAFVKMHIGVAELGLFVKNVPLDGLNEEFTLEINGHPMIFKTADPRFEGYSQERIKAGGSRKHFWVTVEFPALWLKNGKNSVIIRRKSPPGGRLNDIVYWSVDITAPRQSSFVSYNNGRTYRAMTASQPDGKGEFMVRLGISK